MKFRYTILFRTFLMLLLSTVALSGCGSEEAVPPGDQQQETATATTVRPVVPEAPPGRPEPTVATQPQQPVATPLDTLMAMYDVERHFSDLSELASDSYEGRFYGSAGASAAADFISARFGALGLETWSELGLSGYDHVFAGGGVEDRNIIGVLRGTGSGYIILGAHYDHLGLDSFGRAFNGADDNAAGVAAVMEAARVFQVTGLRPARSIVFCAFSGEEQGLYGSSALAALIMSRGLADQVEMINIDGIGATGGNYFGVWDEGAANTGPLVAAIAEASAYLGTPMVEEGVSIGSDAQSFVNEAGIAAVTVDWHWGQDESAFHPNYHTVDDDAQYINKEVLARASKISIASLWLRTGT